MKTKKQRHPRPGAIECLPEEVSADLEWAKARIKERRNTQVEIYSELVERIKGKVPSMPSFRSFNRWVLTMAATKSSDAYPLDLSEKTRHLLAAGLRSLADDLDGNRGDVISPEAVDQARRQFLGIKP